MDDLWPVKFDQNEIKPAKIILEEQSKLLSQKTKGCVYADVEDVSRDAMPFDVGDIFNYSFCLHSKFLKGYSFVVLNFSHDIFIYPAKILLDERIGRELGIRAVAGNCVVSVKDQDEFTQFAKRIFHSNTIKAVIGSILSLSLRGENK